MQQHRDPHQLLVVSATAKQENRARVGSVQAVRSPIRRTQEFEVHHCTKTKQRASTQPPLLLKMRRFKDEIFKQKFVLFQFSSTGLGLACKMGGGTEGSAVATATLTAAAAAIGAPAARTRVRSYLTRRG